MKTKTVIYVIGLSVLLADLFSMSRIIILAYLSSSNQYIININHYNEAILELLLVLFLFPFGLYVLFDQIKTVLKEEKI